MRRRNFISLTTLAAASATIPFLNCKSTDQELDKKLAIPLPLSQFMDENSIKAIGKSYGAARPDEYSLRFLEDQLQKNSEGKTISSNNSIKDIYTFLEKKIKDDFYSGNSMILNGWVISLTEARQCAVYSLIAQSK
ncbi:MAG TPA: hypothetical protein VKT28_14995 [Puia sp.]|nr:hypothetical protein [Puia sp.]